MDNLKARMSNVKFQIDQLQAALAAEGIKVSVKYNTNSAVEEIRFSIVVGKHKERWLIRLYPALGSLTISGGVTKTFFGHNLWVFNNEYVQLQAIIGILAKRLSEIQGITLPDTLGAGLFDSVLVERVELTNHHALTPPLTQAKAISRVRTTFKVLAPNRLGGQPDTFDDPGAPAIGTNKSTKECRVYDPTVKFAK